MNTAAQGGAGNLLMMLIFAVLFIFILMSGHSQKKREQQRQAKITALQKGDQVILQGGIIGSVVGFKDHTLEVKIAEGVKITVLKSSILDTISNGSNQKGGAN